MRKEENRSNIQVNLLKKPPTVNIPAHNIKTLKMPVIKILLLEVLDLSFETMECSFLSMLHTPFSPSQHKKHSFHNKAILILQLTEFPIVFEYNYELFIIIYQ